MQGEGDVMNSETKMTRAYRFQNPILRISTPVSA
jgi:hypothetical protein